MLFIRIAFQIKLTRTVSKRVHLIEKR